MQQPDIIERAAKILREGYVVVLTGNGFSNYSSESISLENYLLDPKKYWSEWLVTEHESKASGDPHLLITRMQKIGLVREIITTSIEGQHQKAQSDHVIELNGNVDSCRCVNCNQILSLTRVKEMKIILPSCTNCKGMLVPDHVSRGSLEKIELGLKAVSNCRSVLVAGVPSTSIYPYSLFCWTAKRSGAKLVCLDVPSDEQFDVCIHGDVSETLREILKRL